MSFISTTKGKFSSVRQLHFKWNYANFLSQLLNFQITCENLIKISKVELSPTYTKEKQNQYNMGHSSTLLHSLLYYLYIVKISYLLYLFTKNTNSYMKQQKSVSFSLLIIIARTPHRVTFDFISLCLFFV